MDRIWERILLKSQLGKVDELNKMRDKGLISLNLKCFMYAILKNRDSLYPNLMKNEVNAKLINSRAEFDPYRSEERYRDFLRKYYLPVELQVK